LSDEDAMIICLDYGKAARASMLIHLKAGKTSSQPSMMLATCAAKGKNGVNHQPYQPDPEKEICTRLLMQLSAKAPGLLSQCHWNHSNSKRHDFYHFLLVIA
jgi:hypothetical protein